MSEYSGFSGADITRIQDAIQRDTEERLDGVLIRLVLNYGVGLGVVSYASNTVVRSNETKQDEHHADTPAQKSERLMEDDGMGDVAQERRRFPNSAGPRPTPDVAEDDMKAHLLGIEVMPLIEELKAQLKLQAAGPVSGYRGPKGLQYDRSRT